MGRNLVRIARMPLDERRKSITELLATKGFASLQEMAARIGVSESTIRRDLDQLEESGAVRRTHGGAYYVGESLSAFDDRTTTALAEKQAIARVAAELIEDGEAVLLDGGTTTLEVARRLVNRRVQVVTNSLPIIQLLMTSRTVELVALGGNVYPKTGVALGPITARALETVHVRRTIMSVGGITEKGLFNTNLLLVDAELRMIDAADELVVVSDHTKFGRQALAHLCELDRVDRMVVDEGMDPGWRTRIEKAGVDVLIAPLDQAAGREGDKRL